MNYFSSFLINYRALGAFHKFWYVALFSVRSKYCYIFFIILKILMFIIYFWETEKETECKWGKLERGRHQISSRLQALSCQHRAQHRAQTQNCEIMTWAEVRCPTDWPTLVPFIITFWLGFWNVVFWLSIRTKYFLIFTEISFVHGLFRSVFLNL